VDELELVPPEDEEAPELEEGEEVCDGVVVVALGVVDAATVVGAGAVPSAPVGAAVVFDGLLSAAGCAAVWEEAAPPGGSHASGKPVGADAPNRPPLGLKSPAAFDEVTAREPAAPAGAPPWPPMTGPPPLAARAAPGAALSTRLV
jgi:hypothetical protein